MKKLNLGVRGRGMIVGGLALLTVVSIGLFTSKTYAEDSQSRELASTYTRFVTVYDGGRQINAKSGARTVREVLERLQINLETPDKVEPELDTVIKEDNYYINIYRARPVLLINGNQRKIVQAAAQDAVSLAKEAGVTLYDGDKVELDLENNLAETGVASAYRIIRGDGQTVTEEQVIVAPEQRREDHNLPLGETKIIEVGQDGRKKRHFRVNFVDGKEQDRELISEAVIVEAKPRIVAVGTKQQATAGRIPAGRSTCAEYARAAGVAEDALEIALDIIYRESGCRVNARNRSSGAYGIPQALPGRKMASAGADWETNPVTQIRWMQQYVVRRYGGWAQAQAFWQKNRWY